MNKRAFIGFIFVLVALIFYQQSNRCACKKRVSYHTITEPNKYEIDKIFEVPDSALLTIISLDWRLQAPIADSFVIQTELPYSTNRALSVLRYYSNHKKYFGAILSPVDSDEQIKHPILLWANGLNQADPTVDIHSYPLQNIIHDFPNHYIIIPSFPGQALAYSQMRYCSDGFFGDAFDGATDDALRLLHLVKSNFTNIDTTKTQVMGVSRGGTVALLMAARDPSIQKTVSIAGPTNFHSINAYQRYGKQFKYQFFNNFSSTNAARTKMIKSSPIYFANQINCDLLLIHGRNDQVVPVSQAESIITQLEGEENFEYRITEDGHQYSDWRLVFDWIKNDN